MAVSYEAIAMIAVIALAAAIISLFVSLVLVCKLKARPKFHYDADDGCWVIDDCVRISDEVAYNVGDYCKYFNYSKKCDDCVRKSPYPTFFIPKAGHPKREERRVMAMQEKKGE